MKEHTIEIGRDPDDGNYFSAAKSLEYDKDIEAFDAPDVVMDIEADCVRAFFGSLLGLKKGQKKRLRVTVEEVS